MNNTKNNEKGFTMVELIIVVAIMGIIGALLVPAFGAMSTKARLTTDLTTVKTLKRTVDSYKAEIGSYPAADSLDALNTELIAKGYLDMDASTQTDGVNVTYNQADGKVILDVTGITDPDATKVIDTLYSTSNNSDFINKNNDGE